jgi:hypothetical protein
MGGHADNTSFYVRDLSIQEFWYLHEVQGHNPSKC